MSSERINVLLIDDNVRYASRFHRMLRTNVESDFTVEIVGSLDEARSYFEKTDPQIIFLNFLLGEEKCSGCTAFIKEFSPHVPIVAMLPSEKNERGKEVVQAGALDFLIVEEMTARVLEIAIFHALERDQASRKLASAGSNYRDLFENPFDVVYTHDLTGKMITVNKMAERLLGYPRSYLLKMNVKQIVAPESLEHVERQIALKTEGEADQTNYEIDVLTRSGRRIPLELNTRLVHDNGKPTWIRGIARDLTVWRQLSEQLRQVKKVENAARLMKASASDLDECLSAMTGWAEALLRDAADKDENSATAQRILKAARRGRGHVAKILGLSDDERELKENMVHIGIHAQSASRCIGVAPAPVLKTAALAV